MSILEVSDVKIAYGSRAVACFSGLVLNRGDRVGLVGPSGCGKTSLLRAICDARLRRAQPEAIRVGQARLAYVPQQGGLLPWFTLRQNIVAFGRLYGNRGASAEPDIAATAFGLDHIMDQVPEKMSGGEYRRAALLVAACQKLDFYIVDEPLTGVDFDQKVAILRLLDRQWQESGTTCLVVSHDPVVLQLLCREIVFIGGAVAQFTRRETVLADPDLLGLGRIERQMLGLVQ